MYIAEKLLIDVEKTNNSHAYYISSDDGKEVEMIVSGKMIISIDENEHKKSIYKLLEDNCDLYFCTTDKLAKFEFYPVPMLAVFAIDSKGTHYGTIGGMGGLGSDDFPVGCIKKDGKPLKIASSFKDFLELVVFYPYWSDIVEYEEMQLPDSVYDIELKQRNMPLNYFDYQYEILDEIELVKNPKSIELLIENLNSSPDFMVYDSKYKAKKENMFIEDINFEGVGNIK